MNPTTTATVEPTLAKKAQQILDQYFSQMVSHFHHFNGLESFTPQPTDIFIDSYMKSGTTLMQQIAYQILCLTGRVPSDPEGEKFNDISQVVPFLEPRDHINIKQSINPYQPNVWKSHEVAEKFAYEDPKTGRFIYCIRNGLHVAESLLDFSLHWLTGLHIEDEALRKEIYRQWFLGLFLELQRNEDGSFSRDGTHLGRWFRHVKSWLESDRERILFLIFEDMLKDIRGTICKVADFMDIEVSSEIVEKVVEKCDRDKMAKDPRFKDNTITKLNGWDVNGGLRVRPADAKGFKNVPLTQECLTWYDQMFYEAFGVRTYAQLVDIVRERSRA